MIMSYDIKEICGKTIVRNYQKSFWYFQSERSEGKGRPINLPLRTNYR